jgi:hypothetical protein
MEKKYHINLRVSGEDPRTLGVRQAPIPRILRWLGGKIELSASTPYEWIGFGPFEKGEAVRFDRDEAKFIMNAILMGSHKERSTWITNWDILKMKACITISPTDPLEKNGARHALLRHADYAEISLHDTERDFTVFRQELNFFKYQSLKLQD